MKKLTTIAASFLVLALAGLANAENTISYDYFEAGWAYDDFDLPDFDEANGGYLDLSVSLDDNAYITLFGTIQDETSAAGFSVGLHHELVPSLDLTAEVGGLYQDISEDFGAFGEFGGRWAVADFLELNAAVGLEWIESDVDVYGIVRAIIPIYKNLSIVAAGQVEEDNQEVRAGFRLNF